MRFSPLRSFGAFLAFMVTMGLSAENAYAVCTNPAGIAGEIVYNVTNNNFQYCNDTDWVRMNHVAGSGSGGCTNPTADEGGMIYNEDAAILQGCAGNVWVALSPPPGSNSGGGSWEQVSTTGLHSCGIKSDGEMYCWGYSYAGVMGDGSTEENYIPSPVSTGGVSGTRWIDVTTGFRYSCGLRDDGTAWCWGEAARGKLGNNTTTGSYSTPQAVVVTGVSGTAWTNIASSGGEDGYETICGIRDDGSMWCWGEGTNGDLGNGANADSPVPVEVDDSALGGTIWTDVTGQCGIRDDGHAYCWGRNTRGQVGMGSSAVSSYNTPQQVYTAAGVSGTSWTAITSGHTVNCGIRDDNTGYCWGWQGYGSRGDGIGGDTNRPNIIQTAGVSGTGWTHIDTGNAITCGVRDDNSGYCWGENEMGELGIGSYGTNYSAPQAVPGDWHAFSVDGEFSCAIRANKTLTCFGDGNGPFGGTLSLGSSTFKIYSTSTVPIDDSATSGSTWIDISNHDFATCGIRDDGTGWCWGSEARNNLARGGSNINTSTRSFHIPTAIDLTGVSGSAWTQMDGGHDEGCGIRDDGTAWCWGWNYSGSTGCSGCTLYHRPLAVTTTGVTGTIWTSITLSVSTACGIRDDGTGYCWGEGSDGQIGNGASADVNAPAPISTAGVTGTAWTSILSGGHAVCGVRNDGSGYCWGDSAYSKIGDNNATSDPNTPQLVSTAGVSGSAWNHISTGQTHSCGIRDDGSAWCWGWGNSGALGNGANSTSAVPVAVSTTGVEGSTWTKIIVSNRMPSASNAHSCGIRNDGSMWCWGDNERGQLGNGTTTDTNVPVKVQPANGLTGSRWTDVDMSYMTVCGLRDSGQMACWGFNGDSQTGIASYTLTPGISTDCTNPDRLPGTVLYNTNENVLQLCNSVHWVAVGGVR